MIWRVKKSSGQCNIVFTTIQTSTKDWYFDSVCSRHMTGKRSYFSKLKECFSGRITFGDGAKGKNLAKENILNTNLPRLDDVKYVEGLTANVINASQLCDQWYTINFSKEECIVTDNNNIVLIKGTQQINNWYQWVQTTN